MDDKWILFWMSCSIGIMVTTFFILTIWNVNKHNEEEAKKFEEEKKQAEAKNEEKNKNDDSSENSSGGGDSSENSSGGGDSE